MAEPLSLIASLIAVAQISGDIVSLCYNYRKCLKDASKQIMMLTDEVKSLRDVLENLIMVVDQQTPDSLQLAMISRLAVKDGPVTKTLQELEALQNKLEPVSSRRTFMKILTWPLEEQEVAQILARINRWKQIFMLAVTTDHLQLTVDIRKDTQAIRNDTGKLVLAQTAFIDDSKVKAVFGWLEAPSSSESLEAARSKRCQETCIWILNHETYNQWHANAEALLWIFGTAGSGKTILSSFVIDQLLQQQKQPDIAVTYFFIDSNELEKRHVDGFVRSILFQLATENPMCLDMLNDRVRLTSRWPSRVPGDGRLTTKDLLEILKLVLQQYSAVYIVIDGIDESLDCEDFLQVVNTVKQWKVCVTRFFVTSRPTKAIRDVISGMGPLEIALEERMVSSDIRKYIGVALDAIQSARKWPPQLTIEVQAHLIQGSHGMFRWVECRLAALRKCIKPLAVRKALSSLPSTLDQIYEATTNKIDQESVDDARAILLWMIAAFRPLHLDEISEVLAFDWEDEPHFRSIYRLPDMHDVLTICGDFLAVRDLDGSPKSQVHLAHSSVRDFLLSKRRLETGSKLALEEGDAHNMAAKVSLSYLLSISDHLEEESRLRKDFPLAGYAAKYWVDHYRLASNKDSLLPLAVAIFDKTNKHRLINWLQLHDIERPWAENGSAGGINKDPASALYYASVAGLDNVVTALLASGETPNPQGGVYRTPLGAAAYKGHPSVVKALLAGGAKVNQSSGKAVTALVGAASRGHTAILKLLLEHDADTIAYGFEEGTALLQAAINGHVEAVRLLLEAGADPNQCVGKRGTALGAAAHHGHKAICEMILEHGGRPDLHQASFSNDTRRAAANGHTEIVELLFKHGSNPSKVILAQAARGRAMKVVDRLLEQGVPADGAWALEDAGAGGSLEIMQKLLATGVDINSHNDYHRTPIAAAAAAGHEHIVRFLLDRGANLELAGSCWAPPLHAAAKLGHVKVVQLLLEHDPPADVHAPGAGQSSALQYGPVLHNACFSGNLQVVEMVLERGANINFRGGGYGNPLQAGVRSRNLHVVEKLLQNGAEVNTVGGLDATALQAAAEVGDVEIVAALLKHGAAVDQKGKTASFFNDEEVYPGHPAAGPLITAARAGHGLVVAMLLSAYAHASLSPGHDLLTAFEDAVRGAHVDCAKVLLGQGIDPNMLFTSKGAGYLDQSIADDDFALRSTGRRGSVDMARILVAAGANVDASSQDGWTAVHEAARLGHFGLVIVLVDEMDANIHSKLVNGSEPIHLAAQEGHDACLLALLERGANINVTNFNGRTPLHVAAENGRANVISTLLQHGAATDLQDTKASMSARDLAEMMVAEWGGASFRFNRDKADFVAARRLLRETAGQASLNLNDT